MSSRGWVAWLAAPACPPRPPRSPATARSLATAGRWAAALARPPGLALPSALLAAFLPRPACSATEVRGEPGPAALPPEPGLLVPAERARRIEPVVGVGPDHARPQPLRHRQDPAPLLGPDPGGQPVRGVVGLGHGLVRGAEREHRQDRAEYLLARDPVGLAHSAEHRRREPVSLGRQRARRRPALRALGLPRRGEPADLV